MARIRSVGSFDRRILVMTSLAGGAKHGYALIKDIEEFSGVTLGPGTLYGCLTQLEEDGFVEALSEEKRRRPFRLTEEGRAALRAALVQSAEISTAGLMRLSGAAG